MLSTSKIFIALVFLGLARFCISQTDGFTLQKIHPTSTMSVAAAPLSPELRAALAQPFIYLGRGAQCFVFASHDGKLVLKFLHMSHIETPTWLRLLPLPAFWELWRQEKGARKERKRHKDFFSYTLAYEKLREETGLVYLHLGTSTTLKQTVHLVDKLGIQHTVDLDKVPFLVQKKAQALTQKRPDAHLLKELVALLKKRQALGIADKDPDLMTNFGVIDGKPVQIDVGRFRVREKALTQEEEKNERIRILDKLVKQLQISDEILELAL